MSDLDLAAMLNNPDTQTLKNQYYDYLSQALSPENKNPEPSSSSLFIRGLLPTLATGLLTGGKALQYAAEPINNTLKTLEDEAKSRAKFNIENSLSGAKLIGDELQTREKRIQDAFDKSESRRIREEDQRRDDTRQEGYQKENLAIRREAIQAGRDNASLVAGAAASNKNDLKANRDRDDARSEVNRLSDDYEKGAKSINLPARTEAIKQMEILIDPSSRSSITAGALGTALAVQSGEKGAKSEGDIKRNMPLPLYSKIQELRNYMTSDPEFTLPPEYVKAVEAYQKASKKVLLEEHENLRGELKDRYSNRSFSVIKPEDVEREVGSLGKRFGIYNEDSNKTSLTPEQKSRLIEFVTKK